MFILGVGGIVPRKLILMPTVPKEIKGKLEATIIIWNSKGLPERIMKSVIFFPLYFKENIAAKF